MKITGRRDSGVEAVSKAVEHLDLIDLNHIYEEVKTEIDEKIQEHAPHFKNRWAMLRGIERMRKLGRQQSDVD